MIPLLNIISYLETNNSRVLKIQSNVSKKLQRTTSYHFPCTSAAHGKMYSKRTPNVDGGTERINSNSRNFTAANEIDTVNLSNTVRLT
ncbi:hypothetical protein T01_11133 [Trichinella spiralis]|uniref:Uncharacterized protein n=1 Tax=Trichinella spiralis TaxID=6334 RepID=A0A0V1BG01_TRISP|nr:hypothetical protein T01_11133 [Trichinella spiralis]